MNKFCLLYLLLVLMVPATMHAQPLSAAEQKSFRKMEDSLRVFSDKIVYSENPAERLRSDSHFVKMLVRTLKAKNSFYYQFDSLQTISKLYSPDSAFRIFTWQLKKDAYFFLQQGAIQIRTPDGSLKLIGLHDASMFTLKPLDSVRGPANWIGAIYYRIILKTYNGRKYYTLLGFDDYSVASNKKWMEVITFDDAGGVQFGGPYISFKEDSIGKRVQNRFNIEYKKEAVTTFNYDPSLDMIVFDQLVSETDEPDKKETLVPDGEFEGFTWKDGQWVHVTKLFNFQLKDGQFPQDEKLLDDAGQPNEQKLNEQSDKNKEQTEKKKTPPKTPVKKSGGN